MMSPYKVDIKQKYKKNSVEIVFSSPSISTKREFKHFREYLYSNIHPFENKLRKYEQYKKSRKEIDIFIDTYRTYAELLDSSERTYHTIPFEGSQALIMQELREKERILKSYLDTYDEKKEHEKLTSMTGLTEGEKLGKVRGMKDTLKKKYSEIKEQIQTIIDPAETQNEKLKNHFIEEEWKTKYKRFFNTNPEFKQVLIVIIKEILEENYSIIPDYIDIKENFMLLIQYRTHMYDILKKREKRLKKELQQDFRHWNQRKPPISNEKNISFFNIFAYILLRSKSILTFEDPLITLSCDVKEIYRNLFELLSTYSHSNLELPKRLKLDTNHFLITSFSRDLMKKINSELARFNENILIYQPLEDKTGVKLNFTQILTPLLKQFEEHYHGPIAPHISSKKEKKGDIVQRYHLKIIIPVALLVILTILGIIFLIPPHENEYIVEHHDSVFIDYTIWESNRSKEYDELNPAVDTKLWIEMIPITENDTVGIILGLYNNLLGKELYYESDLIWLDKCIDENRDGIDDITNKTALSYGNSSDRFFNTPLMIKFKILSIEKVPETQENFSLSRWVVNSIQKAWPIILSILIALSSIALVIGIYYLSKHSITLPRIDFRKAARMVVKYGILIALLVAIPYIVYGAILLRYSPEVLSAMWINNPEGLIFLISAISIPLMLTTAIIYLFLYKKIR